MKVPGTKYSQGTPEKEVCQTCYKAVVINRMLMSK